MASSSSSSSHNVRVVGLTADTVDIEWAPLSASAVVPEDWSYWVRVVHNDKAVQEHREIPRDRSSIRLTGLRTGEPVSVEVGCQMYSAQLTPLAAPAGLRVVTVAATSLEMAWEPVVGSASYRLRWHPVGSDADEHELTVQGACTSAELTGLAAGAPIRVTVFAGDSEHNYEDVGSAPVVVTPLTAPQNLRSVRADPRMVELEWERSPGATHYRISTSIPNRTDVCTTTECKYSIVDPGAAPFEVRVYAAFPAGHETEGASIRVRPLSAVTSLRVAETAASGVSLAWAGCTGATSYAVTWSGVDGNKHPGEKQTGAVTVCGSEGGPVEVALRCKGAVDVQVTPVSSCGARGLAASARAVAVGTVVGLKAADAAAPVGSGHARDVCPVNVTWQALDGASEYMLERLTEGGRAVVHETTVKEPCAKLHLLKGLLHQLQVRAVWSPPADQAGMRLESSGPGARVDHVTRGHIENLSMDSIQADGARFRWEHAGGHCDSYVIKASRPPGGEVVVESNVVPINKNDNAMWTILPGVPSADGTVEVWCEGLLHPDDAAGSSEQETAKILVVAASHRITVPQKALIQDVEVVSIDSTSVKLVWRSGAAQHRVLRRMAGVGRYMHALETAACDCVLEGLRSGQPYDVEIRAGYPSAMKRGSEGSADSSPTTALAGASDHATMVFEEAGTAARCQPLRPPLSLTNEGATSSTLRVAWDASEGATLHRVSWRQNQPPQSRQTNQDCDSVGWSEAMVLNDMHTHYTISDLKEGCQYEVRVQSGLLRQEFGGSTRLAELQMPPRMGSIGRMPSWMSSSTVSDQDRIVFESNSNSFDAVDTVGDDNEDGNDDEDTLASSRSAHGLDPPTPRSQSMHSNIEFEDASRWDVEEENRHQMAGRVEARSCEEADGIFEPIGRSVSCWALAAPSRLNVRRSKDGMAYELSWATVKGASAYDVLQGGLVVAEAVEECQVRLGAGGADMGAEEQFNVYAVDNSGVRALEGSRSSFSLLRPPSDIRVTAVTHGSVTVQWDESIGADSYSIAVRPEQPDAPEAEWKSVQFEQTILSVADSEVDAGAPPPATHRTSQEVGDKEDRPTPAAARFKGVVNGLEPGQAYEFKCFAKSQSGDDNQGSKLVCATPLASPANLTAAWSTGMDVVELEWDPVQGADSYVVHAGAISDSHVTDEDANESERREDPDILQCSMTKRGGSEPFRSLGSSGRLTSSDSFHDQLTDRSHSEPVSRVRDPADWIRGGVCDTKGLTCVSRILTHPRLHMRDLDATKRYRFVVHAQYDRMPEGRGSMVVLAVSINLNPSTEAEMERTIDLLMERNIQQLRVDLSDKFGPQDIETAIRKTSAARYQVGMDVSGPKEVDLKFRTGEVHVRVGGGYTEFKQWVRDHDVYLRRYSASVVPHAKLEEHSDLSVALVPQKRGQAKQEPSPAKALPMSRLGTGSLPVSSSRRSTSRLTPRSPSRSQGRGTRSAPVSPSRSPPSRSPNRSPSRTTPRSGGSGRKRAPSRTSSIASIPEELFDAVNRSSELLAAMDKTLLEATSTLDDVSQDHSRKLSKSRMPRSPRKPVTRRSTSRTPRGQEQTSISHSGSSFSSRSGSMNLREPEPLVDALQRSPKLSALLDEALYKEGEQSDVSAVNGKENPSGLRRQSSDSVEEREDRALRPITPNESPDDGGADSR